MTQIRLELASFRKNLSQLDLTFYSRLVSLLLATSRIDYYVKFFYIKIFQQKITEFQQKILILVDFG